jgi:sugar lactone lactonase YvrE
MKTFSPWVLQRFACLILLQGVILASCSDDNEAVPPPEVVSISPTAGPKTTLVTITGSNFSSAPAENEVTFNGRPATVTDASSSQLTVSVPAAADSGPVIVTVKGKSATSQPAFTFHWLVSTLAGSIQGYENGEAAKFYIPTGVTADASGNLYVTDFGNCVIRKITPSGLASTFAGSTIGLADGSAATAQFHLPNGCAIDKQGNLYIAEEQSHRIRKITPAGDVSTFAGSKTGEPGSTDGVAASALFYRPSGIAVDEQGNVYVADQFNHRIRKITAAGVVSTLAGSTEGTADGTGTAAQFNRPVGVVVDKDGNVYVGDLFNHRIRKITASGVVTTMAGSGYGFADATGNEAKFAFPAGLALDSQGNLYVADTENNRIRKITPSGVVSTFAGSATLGTKDGLAGSAQFSSPREIDIDEKGNIYVVEAGSHRVRKVD